MQQFRIYLFFLIIFITALSLVYVNSASAQNSYPSYEGRWFSDISPWNRPIGDTKELPYSKKAVQAFIDSGNTLNMNWNVWTPAVIEADSRIDKTVDITFKDPFDFKWMLHDVPVNQDLLDYIDYLSTKKDTDRKVCIYDAAKRGFYSFWKIRLDDNGQVTATVGGFSPIDGPGWSQIKIKPRIVPYATPSLGTATGANYCGGLIRKKEMEAGYIDHALAIHWPNFLVLSKKSKAHFLQFPASATDGLSHDPSTAIPAGARLQLSPDLTDEDLRSMGLNDADIVIAHALQKYGGYIMDTTHNPGVIAFENVFGKGKDVYKASAPFPEILYPHLRFVAPPPYVALDTATKVGTPVVSH